jgi:octaprenyl-diphosphate synthase
MPLPDHERIKLVMLQRRIQPALDRMQAAYGQLLSSDSALTAEVCNHIRQGRSKLFRPTLLLLCALDGDRGRDGVAPLAIEAAAAVELVHTATLVHDDFIDGSQTRRGQPAVNAAYGPEVALIMGDLLYTKALDHLGQLGMDWAYKLLTRSAVLMSEAEMLQVEHRFQLDVSEEVYLRIIFQKTASLIECACRIGSSLHPDGAGRDEVFETFGGKTGLVFQITDDIFDYLGDPRRLGKPTGRDWEEGRITLPLIGAWRRADAASRQGLSEAAAQRDPRARAAAWPLVREFVSEHAGVDFAYERARGYADEAKAALNRLPSGARRDMLQVAVEYVVNRLH